MASQAEKDNGKSTEGLGSAESSNQVAWQNPDEDELGPVDGVPPSSLLTDSGKIPLQNPDEDEISPVDGVPPSFLPSYDTSQELELDQGGVRTKARITDEGRLNITINEDGEGLRQILDPVLEQAIEEPSTPRASTSEVESDTLAAPLLNIVVQIIGSRGDVQPFISLGQALKAYGHRVRLATHPTFKQFVQENGLEFFSIGGDPVGLMAFMVKNPGILPSLEAFRTGEIRKRRKEMAQILHGCWRSCIEAGDGTEVANGKALDQEKKPFIADAIIANPPSFAHIHCAERLRVPLHLMFTMPWSSTQAFPHPLANIERSNTDPSLANFMSYALVETMAWKGLGEVIENFRGKDLGLRSMHSTWGPWMIRRLKIPHTYAWSPTLIPKPQDWGNHISVAGFYFLSLASAYTPPTDLASFLDQSPPPIYIGFGSIVVDDPEGLTALVLEAIEKTGLRALLSLGWGGLSQIAQLPENVFLIGNCPHDWLFKRVSCVVHHGGAGTTAAGIAAGVPTVIVPFFGDQAFWGNMIARAGAGPAPIPFKQLTSARLAAAITEALQPLTVDRAAQLGASIQNEDGPKDGVDSFHKQLPIKNMLCSLESGHVPVWTVAKTDIRLSAMAAIILANEGLVDVNELKVYGPCEYNTERGVREPLSGPVTAATGFISDMFLGFSEASYGAYQSLAKKPDNTLTLDSGGSQSSFTSNQFIDTPQSPDVPPRVLKGKLVKGRPTRTSTSQRATPPRSGAAGTSGTTNTTPRNITIGAAEGSSHSPKSYEDTVIRPVDEIDGLRKGLRAAGRGLGFGIYSGVSGLVTQPIKGQKESGSLGLAKGMGIGISGAFLKPIAGVSSVFGFTFRGIFREFQRKFGMTSETHIRTGRMMQGFQDLEGITNEEYQRILGNWHKLQV